MNETVEGCGAFRSPDEGCTFLEEVQEGASDVRKPGDEGAMIPEDSQRRSHLFNGFQYSGPFCKTRNFARVNAEGFAVKQESQVFYLCLFEGALLRLEKEGFSFEEIKNVMDNLPVEGRVVWSGNQDVVHVDEYHVRVF